MYARVFISLHCCSHNFLSQFWSFVNYVSEKYHCVALLCILFKSEIETILPCLKAFLFLWNFHVIFSLFCGLFISLFYFFENNVFIFLATTLLLLLSPTKMEANSCLQNIISFSSFSSPAHRLSSSWKHGLTVVPYSASSLLFPPGDQTRPRWLLRPAMPTALLEVINR